MKNKKLKIVYICFSIVIFIAIALPFFLPSKLLAQTSESNCVVTKVGDPTGERPACGKGGGTSDNANLRAAQDVMAAYYKCNNGDTHSPLYNPEKREHIECLSNELKNNGYSNEQTEAFEVRRRGSLVAAQKGGGVCVQCLGFAGISVALAEDNPGALTGNCIGQNNCAAKHIVILHPDGFNVGTSYYKFIGKGNRTEIQPGDIAVSTEGKWGHIVIAKENMGNARFTAVESNWNSDCKVTDGVDHPKEIFYFYRKQ